MLEKISYEKTNAIAETKDLLIDLHSRLIGSNENTGNSKPETEKGLVESSKKELNEILEMKEIVLAIRELIIG